MTEERFFNEVRNRMENFSPEVPSSVYSGMRKKLWWNNFTRFRAAHLNVWYVAAVSTAAICWFTTTESGKTCQGMSADVTVPALQTAAPAFVKMEIADATPVAVQHLPIAQQHTAHHSNHDVPPTPEQPPVEPIVDPVLSETPPSTFVENSGSLSLPEITIPEVKKGWDSIDDSKKVNKVVTVKSSKD